MGQENMILVLSIGSHVSDVDLIRWNCSSPFISCGRRPAGGGTAIACLGLAALGNMYLGATSLHAATQYYTRARLTA
jgi:hypothetical protein